MSEKSDSMGGSILIRKNSITDIEFEDLKKRKHTDFLQINFTESN
jgi:hypothetical protein